MRTERQLKRELEWHVAYAAQVHNMVERQEAKKLTKETIAKIPVWYISHLVAPNTYFFTTPVQVVWISSQKYKGISMNDLLQKGPDVLNPIPTIQKNKSRATEATLTVGECKDALRDLFLAAQEEVTFPDSTLNILAMIRDSDTGLLLCGGRFRFFNDEKANVFALGR